MVAGGENAIQRQIRVVVGEDTNNGIGVAGAENAICRPYSPQPMQEFAPASRLISKGF